MENNIFYNYNGEKKQILLYQQYNVFIYHMKKIIGIEKERNDLKLYIKLNDLSIDIFDQNTYEKYILNDSNSKEIFCEKVNSDKNIKEDNKKLYDIINNLKDKIVQINSEKLEIVKKNKELENEKITLQNKFNDYKKEANETINKLKNEIINLTIKLKKDKKDHNINFYKKKTPSGNELDNQYLIPKNDNTTFIITKTGESEIEENMSENLIDSKKKETNKNSLINSSNNKIYSFEYNLISYELKTNSKNHQYIKSIIQIKNNGSLILPQNCKIMNSPYNNESDLSIKETRVNKNDIINLNQVVDVTVYLFNKNKVIREGKHIFCFVLYNKQLGIIGEENEISIPIY